MDDTHAFHPIGRTALPDGPAALHLLPLMQMKPFRQGDDWTGTTNPVVRRKLQNRINQRACRNRKNGQRSKSKGIRDDPYLAAQVASKPPSLLRQYTERGVPDILEASSSAISTSSETPSESTIKIYRTKDKPHPHLNVPIHQAIMWAQDFNTWLTYYQKRTVTPFSSDHLLTLMFFNVVRAHSSNVLLLGLRPELLNEDALSPFNDSLPTVISLTQKLPPSLQPTAIQKLIPHHPEADIMPFPRLRDNMILAQGTYDDYAFCEDLVGVVCVRPDDPVDDDESHPGWRTVDEQGPRNEPGLIVWSEPWRPESWEVSEAFAKKWAWLFKGCGDLLKSTNYWRELRGEESLVWEV